jgi:hypothetical protein
VVVSAAESVLLGVVVGGLVRAGFAPSVDAGKVLRNSQTAIRYIKRRSA